MSWALISDSIALDKSKDFFKDHYRTLQFSSTTKELGFNYHYGESFTVFKDHFENHLQISRITMGIFYRFQGLNNLDAKHKR